MSVSINGTSGLVFNDASTQNTAATGFGFKNRIINGAMMIDQRNAGASVGTGGSSPTYSLDRWRLDFSQTSKFTVQQNAGSVTPPSGFTNYLGATSSSAYSVASGDYFLIRQKIEGFNTADLAWGTADAKTVTLSFWVRSSLTGTFSGSLMNNNESRAYPFSYTISSANTWEQKSITIAGDTTGTWVTNNGTGIELGFSLGAGSTYSGTAGSWVGTTIIATTGSVNMVGTNGATFYITGVQLEKGSTATSFDYRPYGTELALCQRYYWRANSTGGVNNIAFGQIVSPTTRQYFFFQYPVPMRATPSSVDAANLVVTPYYGTGGIIIYTIAIDTNTIGSQYANLVANGSGSAGSTQGLCMLTTSSGNSGYVGFNAEL